jgi:hypothetical protein
MMTMKQGQSDRAARGGRSAAAATSSALLFLVATITSSHLIQGAHATTTPTTDGYEFVAVGGCRDTNNNIYSNIRLSDDTAATGNTACAQSCDVFRSTDGFRGYEYQVVFGSDTRCYCLFDSGTDVMTLAESVEGDTTVKADNLGFGEIQSAVNDGIDSYCYKVVSVVFLKRLILCQHTTLMYYEFYMVYQSYSVCISLKLSLFTRFVYPINRWKLLQRRRRRRRRRRHLVPKERGRVT